jgi:hypothetical protein
MFWWSMMSPLARILSLLLTLASLYSLRID